MENKSGQCSLDAMNAKLDILFDQIGLLDCEKNKIAQSAVFLWHSAKVMEFIGLGPMEAQQIYIDAYDTLNEMDLEIGGMIPPYRGFLHQSNGLHRIEFKG